MTFRILLLLTLVVPSLADYQCLCNYNVELPVYSQANSNGQILGYMYEFDCKPTATGTESGMQPIQFEKQEGFVVSNADTQVLQCQGSPSADDLMTTKASQTSLVTNPPTTTPTTPAPPTTATAAATTTSTTTPTPTTTPTTTPEFTTAPTTVPTTPTTIVTTIPTTSQNMETTTPGVPQGHTELCPDHIKTDLNLFGGFLDQYGDYCYELVNRSNQWDNADHHCHIIGQGTLVDIPDQGTQDYVLSFLSGHQYVENVWIGLSDKANETLYTWSSGIPVTFTNFAESQVSKRNHTLSDCVVMQADGKWRDTQCGVSLVLGTGFGESHPYICQYNVTSKPPDIYHVLTDVILG